LDPENSLKWDRIQLNLPGDPRFDPTLPWVMKWDSSVSKIAGDLLVVFVDDVQASSHSVKKAWGIAQQVGS
jgi:hypothetical protein